MVACSWFIQGTAAASAAAALVWSMHWKDSWSPVSLEPEANARAKPLQPGADTAGLLRPADHPLPASLHDPAAALLRHHRRAGHAGRRGAGRVAAGAEDLYRREPDVGAWAHLCDCGRADPGGRSEEHTSELQSLRHLV